jgi:integrase
LHQEARIEVGQVPTKQELDEALLTLFDMITDECETWAATRPAFIEARTYASEDEWLADAEWQQDDHHRPENQREYWQHLLEVADYSEAAKRLRPILAARGLHLDESSVEFKKLCVRAMKMGISAYQRFADGFTGQSADDDAEDLLATRKQRNTVATPSSAPAPALESAPPKPSMPLLSAAFEDFRSAKTGSDWKSKDARDAVTALKLFLDLMGDRPIDQVTAADAWQFRAELARLPRLHGKSVFTGIGPAEAIQLADAIEAGEREARTTLADGKVPRLALKTANKHLTYFSTFYNWEAIRKTYRLENPFEGSLHKKKAVNRRHAHSRQAFSAEELTSLFGSPIWSGCYSEHRRSRPGVQIIRDAKFWAPLIALFAGLRLEEICQLAPHDIHQVEDCWVFDVREGVDQRLKSAAAVRRVPVHAELIRMGLLQRVEAMTERRQQQLFPELRRGGPEQKLGYQLSKDFSSYRKSVGVYRIGRDFHSFRHNFDTALQNKSVHKLLIAYLMGHAGQGMTDGVYFGGFELTNLVDAIGQLNYGLEFDHLYVDDRECPPNTP